jgi:xanthine dehydrogenase accessory factor
VTTPAHSQSCSPTPSVPDANASLLCDGEGRVLDSDGKPAEDRQQEFPALAHEKHCRLFDDRAGRRWLASPCHPFTTQLFLFGAGHVGAALVSVLGQLPCRITWVDERVSLCPSALPANTVFEATDTPEAVVSQAPPGASFLVMTHSHPLDQALAEQILRRGDFGWFGLIGSRTKRIQFERRLLARGIPPAVLARMQCPVGLPGIDGKQPAVIAVAVAAQLLQVWQNQGQLSHGIADRIAS